MDGPRQPPDGHEFPDQEKPIEEKIVIDKIVEKPPPPPIKPREPWISKYEPQVNSVKDKIAIFSKPQVALTKKYVSTSSIPVESSSFGKTEYKPVALHRTNSINDSTPLAASKYRTTASITPQYKSENNHDYVAIRDKTNQTPRLHGRSVSLLDINDTSSHNKFDRWSLLIEQRSLSKLKGLVIPEHEPETDSTSQLIVDLPEIQSIAPPVILRTKPTSNELSSRRRHSSAITTNFQIQPPTEPVISALPKYSPAFKRRSFQIHTSNTNHTVPKDTPKNINRAIEDKNEAPKILPPPIKTHDFSNLSLTIASVDPPKSLESITSPTRSDYSFDYNVQQKTDQKQNKTITTRPNSYTSDPVGSSEYESDTDSALSSSQSSYLSKTSPPASPIHIRMDSDVQKRSLISQYSEASNFDSLNRRLLKPQSVEAINRKNILASAKCRSGKDIKVGSPLIQRKFEDEPIPPSKLSNGNPEIIPIAAERKVINEKVEDKKEPIIPKVETAQNVESNVTTKVFEGNFKSIANNKPIERSKVNFNSSGYSSYSVVRRASSVTDLRKNFEKVAPTPAKRNSINTLLNHSTPSTQPQPIKRTSLPQIIPLNNSIKKEEYKPANTETPKENYDQLIDDAIQEFQEPIRRDDVKVVKVKPDVDGGSIGITLAGGSDYETKEITIHKIRNGSPAFRDGRLKKGDRILAINGKSIKGYSHVQSLKALKENVPEVSIIACCSNNSDNTSPPIYSKQFSLESIKTVSTPEVEDVTFEIADKADKIFEIPVIKDATGLGFSIQGGKSSPQGDVPLVIKKIFMGGAAEKAINLKAGDELLEINHVDVTEMSRMEAWNLMKRLPENEVIIKIRR